MAKKKKGNNNLISVEEQQEEINFNTTALNHYMMITSWEKPNLLNFNEVEASAMKYFELCVANKMKPAVSGLAIVLGMSRKELIESANGGGKHKDLQPLTSKLLMFMEAYDETALKEGKINPVSGIFIMKNNYGYSDKAEVVVNQGEISDDEIRERYMKMGVIINEEEVEARKKK